MANLRVDNLTGTGGRNAIKGSVFFNSYGHGSSNNLNALSLADSTDWYFDGDFTVECWIKPGRIPDTSGAFLGQWISGGGTNRNVQLYIDTNGVITGYMNRSTTNYSASSVTGVPRQTWNHIALVLEGSTLRFYYNGKQTATSSVSGTQNNGTSKFFVGAEANSSGNPVYGFNGYLSNVRVVKGTAVYAGGTTFTPPTEELKPIDGTVLLCCQDSDNPLQEATGKTITGYGDLVSVGVNENLVTNGNFSTGTTGWDDSLAPSETTLSSENQRLKIVASGGTGRARQEITGLTIGSTYKFQIRHISCNSGNCFTHLGTSSGGAEYVANLGIGDEDLHTFYFTATSTTFYIQIGITIGLTGYFDDVSLTLAEPPKEPKDLPPVGVDEGVTFEGDTKINSQSYMYFPTGDTSQRSRGRAILAGSNPASKTMTYVTIQTTGNSTYFGDLITAADGSRGGSSSTRGLFAHSAASSPYTTDIEYVTIATPSNALDFGNLTGTSSSGATGGNDTRAIFWEGTVPSTGVNICYATIASKGDALEFGDMHLGVRHIDTMNSSTRCVIPGGWRTSPDINTNIIQYVTIATLGDAQEFGDVALTGGIRAAGAFSSPTRGVYGGGANSPSNSVLDTIEYITIASKGDATDFGNLTTARRVEGGGTSSHTRGLFTGGHTPSQINTIDYITIATTGNAKDFGDATPLMYTCGALSDCHGGLS